MTQCPEITYELAPNTTEESLRSMIDSWLSTTAYKTAQEILNCAFKFYGLTNQSENFPWNNIMVRLPSTTPFAAIDPILIFKNPKSSNEAWVSARIARIKSQPNQPEISAFVQMDGDIL